MTRPPDPWPLSWRTPARSAGSAPRSPRRSPRPGRPSSSGVLATGGALTDDYALSAPSVLIECWATSSDAAYALAGAAWERLRATVGAEIGPGLWVQDPRITLPADSRRPERIPALAVHLHPNRRPGGDMIRIYHPTGNAWQDVEQHHVESWTESGG